MTLPSSPEAEKITEQATFKESCRPQLDALGEKEIELLLSLREPLSQAVNHVKEDQQRVEEILDRYEEKMGSKRRGESLLANAISEIQKIYNSKEALEGFQDAVRAVDRTLRKTEELRKRRIDTLREWGMLLSDVETYQEKLGSQLPEAVQGARRGEVAASFDLVRIQKELIDISNIILNAIQPEVAEQREEKEPALSEEELRNIEKRLQGLLAKIQSLLAPELSQRSTGPLSPKNKKWLEGGIYQA